jgi:serine phosphatase RsbU (regulator of sigma subunit)/HAMP domain-containing protein
MKKWLVRLLFFVGLVLLYLLSNAVFNGLESRFEKPQHLVFSLPLSSDILGKQGWTLSDFREGRCRVVKIVVAGFFSDWDPQDARYEMHPISADVSGKSTNWTLDVPMEPGDNQYKFVVQVETQGGAKVVVWCPDVHSKSSTPDGYGGFNSVRHVPSFRMARFILSALLLGIAAIIAVFLVLDPLSRQIMHIRLPFPVKLVLNMMIALAVSGTAFIVYNLLEIRAITRNVYVEFTGMLHQALVTEGVDFTKLDSPEMQAKAETNLRRFFQDFRARIENTRFTLRQSTVGNVVIFSPDFQMSAWSTRHENEKPMQESAKESGTDIPTYLMNYRFADLVNRERKEKTGEPLFGNSPKPFIPGKAEYMDRLALGFDHALIPIVEKRKILGYYGLTFYSQFLGRELLRILLFNLLLLPIVGLLAFLLHENIGKNVHRQLVELTEWTQAILRGDFGMEKKIRTHDELEELAENFDQMRLSLGRNMHNLQLINIITSFLQRINDIDELYQVFITFVTADYGFTFNRAAVFLYEGEVLAGRYAVGSIDEAEIVERFGSMQNYINFRMDIQTFLSDYKNYLSRIEGRFSEAVRTISIRPSDGNSAFWKVFHEGKPFHFADAREFRSDVDRRIRDLLHLGEVDILPLVKGGKSVGVLLVDNRFSRKPILPDQVNQLQIILNDFAVNLENASIVRNLERIVEERTHELELEKARVEEKTLELERERNELKGRNEIMEYELEMARKIQMQMIPTRCPIPGLAFYYKPMDKVGGDFFDFIEYPGGKIGIFLSDVSGHGVPAAFITSMIKTNLIQIAPYISNPANMMSHLNSSMMNQTGENFVTAMFGIYDPTTREFNFSNAGHNSPYLVSSEGVAVIKPKERGVPLAVLSNMQLEKKNKIYSNQSIVLPADAKLLLYTDGLTEAVHVMEKDSAEQTQDFESSGLTRVMTENRKLDSNAFVEKIVENLVCFRGSDSFDDDICLICIDASGDMKAADAKSGKSANSSKKG